MAENVRWKVGIDVYQERNSHNDLRVVDYSKEFHEAGSVSKEEALEWELDGEAKPLLEG